MKPARLERIFRRALAAAPVGLVIGACATPNHAVRVYPESRDPSESCEAFCTRLRRENVDTARRFHGAYSVVGVRSCRPVTTPDGPQTECDFLWEYAEGYGGGRGTDLVGIAGALPARRSVGAFLAASAALEQASVTAFARLALELRAHQAPARLVAEALAARADEVRHARALKELAARYGARPLTLRVDDAPARTLEEIALENATEGCVRETLAALLARVQAANATSKHVRAAMAEIAEDELRHACLAWEVAAWAEPRLSPRARARARRARAAAWSHAASVTSSLPDGARRALGLPSASARRSLCVALSASLPAAARRA